MRTLAARAILNEKEPEMTKNLLGELSDALAEAAERAGQATVLVNARRRIPASGIVYAPDLVLTADHVIERDEDLSVTLFDGAEIKATVAGRDPGSDLALLRLVQPVSVVAQPSAMPARIGQMTLTLGRPSAEGLEASFGIVSTIGGPVRTPRGGLLERYLRTEATSYPGFSGGPTVAADGTILGVNTSGLARGMAITIPADLAWKVAAALAAHGHIQRGYIGIRSQPVEIPAAQQSALKREQSSGLLIIGLEDDGPAIKSGLLVGDILVSLGGKPVADQDALFASLSGDVIGKSMPVEVLRGGVPTIVKVVIGER